MRNNLRYICNLYMLAVLLLSAGIVVSCSSISHLDPDEQLFTGLKPIEYGEHKASGHYYETQAEVEAALATAPNGALFGSSFYRTPFPYGLWIYNAYNEKEGRFAKWFTSSFGKAPVLMSKVNPELRTSVAASVLANHGYFRGKVDYDIIYGKPKITKHDSVPKPRTAKIAYKVDLGPLFTIDSISYSNFSDEAYNILMGTKSILKSGDPFDISALDKERNRISKLFRNHGYYFYQPSFTSYLADTLKVKEKVQLQLHMADSLSDRVTRKWVIGRVNVKLRRQGMEQLTDSIYHRLLRIHFGGKHPPIRPRVVLADVRMRPGDFFSQDKYDESMNRLVAKGIFSSASIELTPRVNADGTDMTVADTVKAATDGMSRVGAGVLDMTVNCTLDKPYDITLQANYLGKTSGRMGPGVSLGFAKRNAFRGGELLSLNLAANYEFQAGATSSSARNNYELSGDLTLSMPRLLLPKFITGKRRRWQTTPSTIISVARETINRSGFFRRHILSGELSYVFQPTPQSNHQFSPLTIEYDRMAHMTEEYEKMIMESPFLLISSNNYFLPKMRYTYRYTSPQSYLNPIFLSVSLTEASNIMALGYALAGRSWNEKEKTAFGSPFSQFLKMEAEWKKSWRVGDYSSFVAHAQVGALMCLGNSSIAPFSEQFYVGGANNIRAFQARSIGPGRFENPDERFAYVTNTGNLKLIANLEYRPRILGSLYGAIFLDAGNVWDVDGGGDRDFVAKHVLNDIAVGTGVGIRYDLDFFVLRIDWGIALHTPYDTGKSGYFNMNKFSKAQCLNFAIGYPF